MKNLIVSNLSTIRRRHYAQKATSSDNWVAFYKGKLNEYLTKFGENFALIIYANKDDPNDFISIPYSDLREFLTDDHLDKKNRWVFSIENNKLRVHKNSPSRLDVSQYRSNLDILQNLTVSQSFHDI